MPTEVILEVSASTRFRRVPRASVLDITIAEEKHCDRSKGHVLQVQHCGRIVCRECGAEWKDMGY